MVWFDFLLVFQYEIKQKEGKTKDHLDLDLAPFKTTVGYNAFLELTKEHCHSGAVFDINFYKGNELKFSVVSQDSQNLYVLSNQDLKGNKFPEPKLQEWNKKELHAKIAEFSDNPATALVFYSKENIDRYHSLDDVGKLSRDAGVSRTEMPKFEIARQGSTETKPSNEQKQLLENKITIQEYEDKPLLSNKNNEQDFSKLQIIFKTTRSELERLDSNQSFLLGSEANSLQNDISSLEYGIAKLLSNKKELIKNKAISQQDLSALDKMISDNLKALRLLNYAYFDLAVGKNSANLEQFFNSQLENNSINKEFLKDFVVWRINSLEKICERNFEFAKNHIPDQKDNFTKHEYVLKVLKTNFEEALAGAIKSQDTNGFLKSLSSASEITDNFNSVIKGIINKEVDVTIKIPTFFSPALAVGATTYNLLAKGKFDSNIGINMKEADRLKIKSILQTTYDISSTIYGAGRLVDLSVATDFMLGLSEGAAIKRQGGSTEEALSTLAMYSLSGISPLLGKLPRGAFKVTAETATVGGVLIGAGYGAISQINNANLKEQYGFSDEAVLDRLNMTSILVAMKNLRKGHEIQKEKYPGLKKADQQTFRPLKEDPLRKSQGEIQKRPPTWQAGKTIRGEMQQKLPTELITSKGTWEHNPLPNFIVRDLPLYSIHNNLDGIEKEQFISEMTELNKTIDNFDSFNNISKLIGEKYNSVSLKEKANVDLLFDELYRIKQITELYKTTPTAFKAFTEKLYRENTPKVEKRGETRERRDRSEPAFQREEYKAYHDRNSKNLESLKNGQETASGVKVASADEQNVIFKGQLETKKDKEVMENLFLERELDIKKMKEEGYTSTYLTLDGSELFAKNPLSSNLADAYLGSFFDSVGKSINNYIEKNKLDAEVIYGKDGDEFYILMVSKDGRQIDGKQIIKNAIETMKEEVSASKLDEIFGKPISESLAKFSGEALSGKLQLDNEGKLKFSPDVSPNELISKNTKYSLDELNVLLEVGEKRHLYLEELAQRRDSGKITKEEFDKKVNFVESMISAKETIGELDLLPKPNKRKPNDISFKSFSVALEFDKAQQEMLSDFCNTAGKGKVDVDLNNVRASVVNLFGHSTLDYITQIYCSILKENIAKEYGIKTKDFEVVVDGAPLNFSITSLNITKDNQAGFRRFFQESGAFESVLAKTNNEFNQKTKPIGISKAKTADNPNVFKELAISDAIGREMSNELKNSMININKAFNYCRFSLRGQNYDLKSYYNSIASKLDSPDQKTFGEFIDYVEHKQGEITGKESKSFKSIREFPQLISDYKLYLSETTSLGNQAKSDKTWEVVEFFRRNYETIIDDYYDKFAKNQ